MTRHSTPLQEFGGRPQLLVNSTTPALQVLSAHIKSSTKISKQLQFRGYLVRNRVPNQTLPLQNCKHVACTLNNQNRDRPKYQHQPHFDKPQRAEFLAEDSKVHVNHRTLKFKGRKLQRRFQQLLNYARTSERECVNF